MQQHLQPCVPSLQPRAPRLQSYAHAHAHAHVHVHVTCCACRNLDATLGAHFTRRQVPNLEGARDKRPNLAIYAGMQARRTTCRMHACTCVSCCGLQPALTSRRAYTSRIRPTHVKYKHTHCTHAALHAGRVRVHLWRRAQGLAHRRTQRCHRRASMAKVSHSKTRGCSWQLTRPLSAADAYRLAQGHPA